MSQDPLHTRRGDTIHISGWSCGTTYTAFSIFNVQCFCIATIYIYILLEFFTHLKLYGGE